VADGDIVAEDSPEAEEDAPIVVAGADERKFLRTGVGHVSADVEKIFEEPERAEGDCGGFAFEKEKDETGERGDEFEECAAEDGHGVAERAEERMAGFVDEEIGEIDEEKIWRVDGGVKKEKRVDDEPGDAGDFRDGFPFVEIVGELNHSRRVATQMRA